MTQVMLSSESIGQILEDVSDPEIRDNPYNFVMWAYEWGVGDLERFSGPREWQREEMLKVAAYLKDARGRQDRGEGLPDFFRAAIASGRGPGKSALLGMLSHWFISTRIGGSVWIAANGEPQLRTKTFPEIAKWVMRGVNSSFFEINAMSIQPAKWFREMIESPVEKGGLGKSTKYYYASGQLWSEENPDAFAGAHNWDGEMAIFDEASGIPDPIWTVQEGVFTESIVDRFWFAFSNPRVNQGAFFEAFHKNRDRWRTTQIDSRTVEGIDHSAFNSLIEQFGPDSNEARVEVYGQFPTVGDNQFIDGAVVDEAIKRKRYEDDTASVIIGVDVARFGDDKTSIAVRKGRDLVARMRYSGLDTMQVVGRVIEMIEKFDPDLTVIDEGGLGAGVLDRLKEQGYNVRGVNFGNKANDGRWGNKRTEMWGEMRDWLKTASIGSDGDNAARDDRDMKIDLCGPQYKLDSNGRTMLEQKSEMKKRGLSSPDEADALAITFAYRVAAKSKSKQPLRHKQLVSSRGSMLYSKSNDGSWMV